jgi:hypothetical protein
MTGGQHGEEEKSGEKGEEGQTQEEEVVLTPPNGLRLRTMSMTASNGPA